MKQNEYLLKSFDGTLINVFTIGKGDNVIVVSNGLGGNFKIFKEIIKEFPDFKFISWDYRGLYKSHMPKNKNDVTLKHHINDLEAILKKENIKKAIFLGWSIGATINIHLYNKNPDYFKALILLNPVSKETLKEMLPITRLLRKLDKNGSITIKIPFLKNNYLFNKINTQYLENIISPEEYLYKLLKIVQKYHKLYSRMLKISSKIPKIGIYFKKLKLVNSNMDDYFFEDIFKEYAKLNMELYIEIIKNLLKSNENISLSNIKVPVLLISATRDIFVPISSINKIRKLIPNIDYLEVFRGSHYSLIEFPEMITLGIKRFLRNI